MITCALRLRAPTRVHGTPTEKTPARYDDALGVISVSCVYEGRGELDSRTIKLASGCNVGVQLIILIANLRNMHGVKPPRTL
jgi:hypothetical protein